MALKHWIILTAVLVAVGITFVLVNRSSETPQALRTVRVDAPLTEEGEDVFRARPDADFDTPVPPIHPRNVNEQGTGASSAGQSPRSTSNASERASSREKKVQAVVKAARGKPMTVSQIETLATSLKDTSSTVRATAATALGRSQSPDAIEPLVSALLDSNVDVRRRAAKALKKLVGVEVKYDAQGSKSQRERSVNRLSGMIESFKNHVVIQSR